MDLVELSSGVMARRHPWEEARFAFFARALGRAGVAPPGTAVLDVGAGDAWFAARLAEEAGVEVTCWDIGYAAGTPPAARGLLLTAEPPRRRFPLVLALDVLEHVEDDRRFLRGLVDDQLEPGGHLLVSVPAWPALFSRHDQALRHVRRYAPAAARALLEGAGLRVLEQGGLFHALLAPRAAQKLTERWASGPARLAGDWSAPAWVTAAVAAALALDGRASALFSRLGWNVPGLSWWALCRGP